MLKKHVNPIAIFLAVCMVLAFKKPASSVHCYAVVGEDLLYYYVIEIGGQTEDIDYICDWSYLEYCIICTEVVKDHLGRVIKETVVSRSAGRYIPLNDIAGRNLERSN